MNINADFSARVVVHSSELEWQPSPIAGVERRMLDRIGEEVARATSIVRYAPGSHFSAHTHGGGEEFIVLEGVFQDEHGDYPTGSYIRNPPTSSHTPGAEDGCTIFVKLWQFDPDDRTQVKTDMNKMEPLPVADRSGVMALSLFHDDRETVRVETWEPDTVVTMVLPQGGEFLLLNGGFTEGDDMLETGGWLRLPEGATLTARAGPQGAKVWMKLRHLPHVTAPQP